MNEKQLDMENALTEFVQRLPVEASGTFAGQMKPQLEECSYEGRYLIFSYRTEPWMRNPGGDVHGGVIAETISMTLNALAWYYAGRRQNPAISIQLSYPRPAKIGPKIYVQATAISAGRTIAHIGATAWQNDNREKPFATGTGVHYTAVAIEDD